MGRRTTRGRKRKTYKQVNYADEDKVQVIQETNAAGDGDTAAEEMYPFPSSSRHSTRSNNAKVAEANLQSYTRGDQAEEIASQPLEKECELNREPSPNLTDLVQKLNKNVSDAEEVCSATHTALVTVSGYKVKGDVAPALREILDEHGDIASECILQAPESRAALLESVCMIYRELEPKFPNISSLDVNSVQARIKDLETVRLRVEWLYKRLEEISTVKGLLDKSKSLDEARVRCAESIVREERDLEALEAELSNLQHKISSKKAELALLKTEAETIEAAFETMARLKALPEPSVVSMTRRTGGKEWNGLIPSSKVLNHNDAQLHSQTTLQHNTYKFFTDTHQQLRENDHPNKDHVSVAYLRAQPYNPQSHSQSFNLPCNSQWPHSVPQPISQNLQHRSSQSNLHTHSNCLSKRQHPARFSSENECDQNYDASSDDVNDMNTPGGDCTPTNDRGSQNPGLTESSSRRVRGIRGSTKPLRGWGTGQKMMLQLNEHNQIIGKLAVPFASQLGVLAKDGRKLPLIYTDWRTIPETFKDRIWKEIKDNTNLHDDYERTILRKLSVFWRNWKGKVKKLHFTPYKNDNEKLAQHPPDARIEKDQWPILVRFWKSKPALELPKENKININDQRMEISTGHQIDDDELEPEIPGQVHSYSPEMTPSKILTGTKMKQKSMSELRGHMAFAVLPNRTQVPESSSVQATTPYLEDHRRARPNSDSASAEVGSLRKRKKM